MSLTSCDWTKNKTKKVINRTGEVIGKTGSEFGNGVYKGVKKTFENDVNVSKGLNKAGLQIGEVTINSSDSTTDNQITVYVIFNENFNEKIIIKIYNENGKEYGRLSKKVKGVKGETDYIDFTFDNRVHIATKGHITIEQVE